MEFDWTNVVIMGYTGILTGKIIRYSVYIKEAPQTFVIKNISLLFII